ncbi:cyclic lactone autoinducer peptide [Defluviitalea saccharophila]|uniref:Cyclic lactone autoinducer peptide n=1 Tax=Defluviitalea saccharophila TaxID=879970 RepID=A0ABZ2YB14_9FIRM
MKKNMQTLLKWIGSASLIFAVVSATPACFLLCSQPKCPKSLQK